jgi:quercetin dioxygenase-like cupin family protein
MINHIEKIKADKIKGDGINNVLKQVLVSPNDGWENHVMRRFSLGETGFTPFHSHPWPHIIYILEGDGSIIIEKTKTQVKSGSIAFIPPDSMHQFKNAGEKNFIFLCIVPNIGDNCCNNN